jgi:large subunit ribosomal protein L7/L12
LLKAALSSNGRARRYDQKRKENGMTFAYILIGIIVVVAIAGMIGGKTIPSAPQNVSDEDIQSLAMQGQKIQAIKWYRSLHGVGLKDAKDAVEKMIEKS